MAHPSKRKGNRFERLIVKKAKEAGIQAERAWGSNGRSLGLTENVDCLVGGYKAQAKHRKKIAGYMTPDDDVDVQIIKEDRCAPLVVMPYEMFLTLIQQ